jgi:phage terminase small subunit
VHRGRTDTSERYAVFAREFAIHMNATRAAIAAGYSQKTAGQQASCLLKNLKVKKLLDAEFSKRAVRAHISQDRVLEEISTLALSNMDDFCTRTEDGRIFLDPTKMTRDQMRCIQEIKEDTTGGNGDGERRLVVRTTFKLADKAKNLDMLMRHLGAYNDKLKIDGLESLPDLLAKRWGDSAAQPTEGDAK